MTLSVSNNMTVDEVNKWADHWRHNIGANVIPATTKVKKPLAGILWTEWQNQPIPQTLHEKWKRDGLFQNGMAVVCGKLWHNPKTKNLYLCAIDCDNGLAVDEVTSSVGVDVFARDNLIEMHLDNRNKCHIYYLVDSPITGKGSNAVDKIMQQKIRDNIIPAIEIKSSSSRGLMYVTPSVHKNGSRYEILGRDTPRLLGDSKALEQRLEDIFEHYGISYLENRTSSGTSLVPMSDIVNGRIRITEGGNRKEAILRYAEHLWKTMDKPSFEEIVRLARLKDQEICDPPLVTKYSESEIPNLVKQGHIFITNNQEPTIVTDIKIPSKKNPKKTEKSHEEWANDIQMHFNFKTLEETDEVLWYYEGVYMRGGEIQIKKVSEQIVDECNTALVNEIINTIKRRTYISIKRFDSDPTMINVKNCWINITDGSATPHSPDIFSLVQLDVFFDPVKIPVKFNMFLRQCHKNSKAIYQLWESFASCLLKTPKFAKAFMHIGLGANGKSVYLKVINTFLGNENVSNMSIHTIEYNRFAPAQLHGKLANIYADISSEELKQTGNFKNIVSGDNITAEKKGKDPFEFIAYSKMFFSANQIPKVFDESDGFFRRFIITEWDKQFSKKEQNPNLIAELTTDDEKSGILNILIAMAKTLDKRGYFKYDVSTEHLRSQWKKKSDSVSAFNDEMMVFDPMHMIDKNRYYEKYIEYCRDNKIPPITRKKDFLDEVKNGTPLEDDGKPVRVDVTSDSWFYLKDSKEKGKLKRVWRGGMLKSDIPPKNGTIDRHTEVQSHA
jgi:putative DNA primase/helicase